MMNKQQHVIKRQVLEVMLSDPAEVNQTEVYIKSIYYQNLLPMINKCFDKLAVPGVHHQLDKLEIDFDVLDDTENRIDRFYSQLQAQVEKQLKSELPHTELTHFSLTSGLDQLHHFLQAGILPWWAQRLNRQEFNEWLLKLVLEEKNSERMFSQLLHDKRSLKRGILQFSDPCLLAIALKLTPRRTAIQSELRQISLNYAQLGHNLGINDSKLFRLCHWQALFAMIGLVQQRTGAVKKFCQHYWHELANLTGGSINDWRAKLLDSALLSRNQQMALSTRLINKNPAPAQRELSELIRVLEQINQLAPPSLKFQTAIHQLKVLINSAARHQLDRATVKHCLELVRFAEECLINVVSDSDLLHNSQIFSKKLADELTKLHRYKPQPLRGNPINETDEQFIANAGLILLWPYLAQFFSRHGLLNEECFNNAEAAMRAAIILQKLLLPMDQPSEPDLVLNKLLCGLELDEPIWLDIELTEAERLAGEALLKAVATNWPALKTNDPAMLRQLFLQRNGSLQISDGSYLLRVERKSHDILLDKLPWTISNIKLPWLDYVIRTEW